MTIQGFTGYQWDFENMSIDELKSKLRSILFQDNFILQTDSYKLTHHLLMPEDVTEVYSYAESRGGRYPYSVWVLLSYYLQRYMTGVRITHDHIDEAAEVAAKHFGSDKVFNEVMWRVIADECGGMLPMQIRSLPEGTVFPTRVVPMDMVNTHRKCAALTNATETLLMKMWAPATVATYARVTKELQLKYWNMTSDVPVPAVDYYHHDFGYRGVSSEETARILGAAALTQYKGTDTLGAIKLLRTFYNADMPANSVIASEHSIVCLFGNDGEAAAYTYWLQRVKEGILSLVSDTRNIYNVCDVILPDNRDLIMARNGKTVVRLDSGVAIDVIFGTDNPEPHYDERTAQLAREGVLNILGRQFGYTVNSKGYKVLNEKIGVLQGDGVSYDAIVAIYDKCIEHGWCVSNIVFGSGGKYLQAHDRDVQKWAIKAANAVSDSAGSYEIFKSPITDIGKGSKHGYQATIYGPDGNMVSVQTRQYAEHVSDLLRPVFMNGSLTEYADLDFDSIRERCAL